MMEELEVTGKTVDEAIENGLKKLGISREDAEIKILDEGKSGLFGLMGSSPAKVKIFSKINPETQKGIPPSTQTQLPGNAADVLAQILKLSGFVAEVSTGGAAGDNVLNISSEDSAILIGRQGQTMKSLEYILKLILSKQEGKGVRLALNIDGYLERKNEKIVEKAKEIEEKVKSTGEAVELKLPAAERKTIHITLKDSPYVETVSEGDGEDRKLIVRPKKA